MGDRRTTGEKIFAVFNTIFLVILAVVFILPVWHVAMSSISDPDVLQPNSPAGAQALGEATLGGFKFVLDNPNIPARLWKHRHLRGGGHPLRDGDHHPGGLWAFAQGPLFP